ncbi:MAG: restriction endonuclease subunit S [Selenomonadaceae bacterium]
MVNRDQWKQVKLGDLGNIITGSTPKTSDGWNYSSPDVCFYKPSDISENRVCYLNFSENYISETASAKVRMLPAGSVLVTCIGIIGKIAILENEGTCNQQINAIIPTKDKCNNKYLSHCIYYNKPLLQGMANAAVVPIINKKQFSEVSIPLPPIETQKQIAAILDKASQLIELRKQQLEKMDLLIKSKFIAMFGDEKTAFRKWECKKVSDLAEVNVGVVIKPAQYYTDEVIGTKAFRSLNIGEMKVNDTEWVYFSEEGNQVNRKSILREGQLLIVRSGYPGTACVVTKEYEGCNAIDVIIATPDFKKVNSVFLCAYTNYAHGKNQIMRGKYGAAQQHFNVGAYKNLIVGVPPIALQNEFAAFVDKVEAQKAVMQASLAKLEINYKALMQQYFG